MDPTKIKIRCLECNRYGPMCDFNNNCDKENCKITMARRNKNHKPPALVLPARHHESCVCDRCLDDGVTTLGAAIMNAKRTTPPVAAKMRVQEHLSSILSSYDAEEDIVYVDVPDAICITINPRGKRK